MLKRLTTAATCLLILNACGPGAPPEPPPPPPFTPVGTYDVSISGEGFQMGGVLTIEGSDEAGYSGFIDTEMGGAALSGLAVDGTVVTFSIPEAGVEARLEFEGDAFVGSMSGAMGDGGIEGVRRPGG